MHHSRDTAEKQWAETRVLTLAGVARTFTAQRKILQRFYRKTLWFVCFFSKEIMLPSVDLPLNLCSQVPISKWGGMYTSVVNMLQTPWRILQDVAVSIFINRHWQTNVKNTSLVASSLAMLHSYTDCHSFFFIGHKK